MSLFKEYLFPSVKPETLYKKQMNGLSDPSLYDFDPLVSSLFLREPYKEESFEHEFIYGFLKAATVIAKSNHQQKTTQKLYGIYCLSSVSLALPCLYLCRHAIELTLKRAIKQIGGKPKITHNLIDLWNSFRSYLSEKIIQNKKMTAQDEKLLTDLFRFISIMDTFDDTGEKLRYSKSKKFKDIKDSYTQNTFYWVNELQIVELTEKFTAQLEALNEKTAGQESS